MNTIPETMIPILAGLRTQSERDQLREQVGELEAALFRSDPKGIEKILTSHLPEYLAVAMRSLLASPAFQDNPEALRKFFQDLRETIDKLPILKVNIAFKPTEEMIARLHEWAQKNLGLGVVLDIGYDGLMLGGARIIFGGRYKEMTLAQMITDVFAKEKTTILKMIK